MPSKCEPIRILHALSLDTIGGVETLFHTYLAREPSGQFQHHVLVMRGPCHSDLAPGIRQHAQSVSTARYWRGLKLPRRPAFFRQKHLHSLLREVHPEVVIIYNSLGDLDLWQAVEQSGAVRIYYEHGAAWLTDRRTEVECLLSHSDGIICNSHAARRILELRWGIPQGLAEVLLNPIREGLGSATLEPKILDKGRPLHLGTAGRLISLKGFALAIHAIRHLRDDGIACELHLAGEGPEETRLCALAKNLGLGNEIRFPGRVSDMAAFYRQLDIFLCPSIREPLGNVCIEAGYLGCPVICSAVDGLPEVVLDESTGFCLPPSLPAERYDELGGTASELPKYVYDPKTDSLTEPKLLDPAQIAAKVRFLNDHPDTYTAMSAAAHQHVASRFDIGGYVQGLNRLILQARARSKAAPS